MEQVIDINNTIPLVLASHYNFHIITAHSFPNYGIGINNQLPWDLKKELNHFKTTTTQKLYSVKEKGIEILPKRNIIIFGRLTWNSISDKGKKSILKDRYVIVITSTPTIVSDNGERRITWNDLPQALYDLRLNITVSNHVFFAGGETIYNQAFKDYPINCAHITEVYIECYKNDVSFSKYFPEYDPNSWIISTNPLMSSDTYTRLSLLTCSPFILENNIWYRHKMYATPHFVSEYYTIDPRYKSIAFMADNNVVSLWKCEEQDQYLDIMRDIIEMGMDRDDRTGVGTRSVFSTRQVYDLSDTFPIATTRRQWLKGIFEELKLYITGKTDNALLQSKNIHIWDGNTSREFLDSRGLTDYPTGDMGETYGFNFRHFGGNYIDCHTSYDTSTGYDQVSNVIHLLKNDPTSRRIIINLWNPATLHKAALPSCLLMYQFYVDTDLNKLHCQIYIRSSDYFLANNWNCCTGALLVHMLCSLKDIPYTPGSISVITGDTHIYKNHFNHVQTQLKREPNPFPKLEITRSKEYISLDDIEYNDLRLIGYRTHPSISAPMAV